MVAIKNLFLFATTAFAAVLPRDAATILADLKTIDSDTKKLTSAVNSWNGQLFTATTISSAESALESDVKKATSDANASGAASEADAKSIISYITGTLEPDIAASIKALEAKKAQFKSAGLSNTVLTDLKNLKSESDSLGAALKSKAPSDQQTNAQNAINKIDSDFSGAITYFSS